ncbi:response regulator transcription factor [Galbibacter mesophilus]|uniref:response regulator transcription factor n=1 Tax=Galbibacter mesophilus TaxID=379069 RepID=UPI00191D2B03|nr:DNA-binding response regulator [Galbibacter mesophilus]MCM5662333.1 DNA-binding response regulator [Galbibacter mesophilus]
MRKKILVLEDDIVIAKSIQLDLTRNNFDVLVATRYSKGEVLFKQHRFDAAVCDINLNQQLNGVDFVKDVIKDQIPVVFLTAYSDDKTIKKVERVSPYAFLTKPFNNNQLVLTLKLALKNNQGNKSDVLKGCKLSPEVKVTRRELEVVAHMSLGKTTKEIADNLCISSLTVSTHRKNILNKTNTKNSIELIALAKQMQWI